MTFNYVKNLWKYLSYKQMYSDAQIGFGARVKDNCILGSNVFIDRDCYIVNSSIGDNTYIANNCFIFKSVLGNIGNIGNIEIKVFVKKNCNIMNSTIGDKTHIDNNSSIVNSVLGNISYIGINSFISVTKIGNFCSIGPSLICAPGEHPTSFISTSPAFYLSKKYFYFPLSNKDYFEPFQETQIGHDVWIGANVFIKNGVKIGNGAIIAAGAVVVKDVPDYAIVGGVPAKLIRMRFSDEIISSLLKIEWWNWSEDRLREAQPYFVQKDINSFIEWTIEREYALL